MESHEFDHNSIIILYNNTYRVSVCTSISPTLKSC